MSDTGERVPPKAYLVLACGLLSISTSVVFIRMAGSAPGEAVAVWRTVFGALLVAPWSVLRARDEIRGMEKREWALILLSGVFLGLHFVTWINSLYHTSVASAASLVALSPLFLAILGFLVLKERLRGAEILALIVATMGVAALGWIDRTSTLDAADNPILGNSLALSAAAFMSVYLLVGRFVRQRRSWLAYVGPVYVVTAVTTVVVAKAQGIALLGWSWEVYALCLGMAFVPHLMGHGSVNWSLRYVPAATVGLASLGLPVFSSLWGALFFGEIPTPPALGAMALILGSLILVVKRG
ncbi:MAG: DMT family transporter [Bacteroidetes bacterium]|nr:DMT family transporter [Bacteroidota bacterium]